jgi:hypothetical protein
VQQRSISIGRAKPGGRGPAARPTTETDTECGSIYSWWTPVFAITALTVSAVAIIDVSGSARYILRYEQLKSGSSCQWQPSTAGAHGAWGFYQPSPGLKSGVQLSRRTGPRGVESLLQTFQQHRWYKMSFKIISSVNGNIRHQTLTESLHYASASIPPVCQTYT